MQMVKCLEVLIIILYVCVHTLLLAQTFPYISFQGHTLANHSYVNLSLVGGDTSGSDSVQCITDLMTCCSSAQGPHRGDWYFPDGTQLPFSGVIRENRDAQSVSLCCDTMSGINGIYRCDVPTTAVRDGTNTTRDTVYVGLYLNGEGEHCLQL